MQVSDEKLTLWGSYKDHGDIAAISKILGLGVQQTSSILKSGKGSALQVKKINAFYEKRKKEVESQIA